MSWKTAAIASIVSSIIGWYGSASAQNPICPEPSSNEPVYTACSPNGRFVVVPLLTNFAIDLLLKGDSGPLTREPRLLLSSIASRETIEKNSELAEYMGRLEPLTFVRIDTVTGTLRLNVDEEERSFATKLDVRESPVEFQVDLPARLEGGYWRTPGVIQVAFWRGQRASFSLKSSGGISLAAEVDCITVSADGVRISTSDTSLPDIVIEFGACE